MTKIRISVAISLILFLSACGFRMAGKADLDPVFESTYVGYSGTGQTMAELLKKQFKANKFDLVDQESATAIVTILYERRRREILSLDEDGKAREYELILQVGVNAKTPEGEVILRNQDIRLTRDFLFDINAVLGKASEQQEIYQEMREDAARLIIYRLQAYSPKLQEEG